MLLWRFSVNNKKIQGELLLHLELFLKGNHHEYPIWEGCALLLEAEACSPNNGVTFES